MYAAIAVNTITPIFWIGKTIIAGNSLNAASKKCIARTFGMPSSKPSLYVPKSIR